MPGDSTLDLIVCGHSYTELVAAKRTTVWTVNHSGGGEDGWGEDGRCPGSKEPPEGSNSGR